MTEEIQHPDPDRWWRRKFILACSSTGFAGAVLLAGIILEAYGKDVTLVLGGVWAFMTPILAYLGLAEADNIWGKR